MDEMKIEIPEDLRDYYGQLKYYLARNRYVPLPAERAILLIERVATLTTANVQLQAERDALKATAESLKEALANTADMRAQTDPKLISFKKEASSVRTVQSRQRSGQQGS
jgi:hypothetical protein